ncbi:alpha/beta hydrolase [Nocardioides sp. zg-DK7169]|uniref:alpha/beta hydrolase n=1 Tax=Nocardioides sp. zg-DK7169 TaxID=2736600 RepID=UPI001554C0E2|nr:alpha/beta hydrolase [Nocardioides sp. zg-DK7169]NPC98683.1 alpha/beta hydrolase [Nocardioides sp. zg-DK7169]
MSDDLATDVPLAAEQAGITLEARFVPAPTSVSPAARARLSTPAPAKGPLPALDDAAGWRAHVEAVNGAFAAMMREPMHRLPATVRTETIGGVVVHVAEPHDVPEENRDKALVYLHGGALVLLGGECTELFARQEAASNRVRVYAVDYRTPPDHPYPAALEDCVAVYRALLETHGAERVVVSGASGGANLAAALPLRLRELGLPLPSAVALLTPEVDLTESGDTFVTNRELDVVLPRGLPEMNRLYAAGADLTDPLVSPLFGDFAPGYPPTYLQTGTRDLFLSNTVRMHRALRRAGQVAELHVWEAMPHGGFGGAPEDRERYDELAHFLARHAGWAPPA